MDAVLISLLTILLGFVLILIIFHTNWWVEIPRIDHHIQEIITLSSNFPYTRSKQFWENIFLLQITTII